MGTVHPPEVTRKRPETGGTGSVARRKRQVEGDARRETSIGRRGRSRREMRCRTRYQWCTLRPEISESVESLVRTRERRWRIVGCGAQGDLRLTRWDPHRDRLPVTPQWKRDGDHRKGSTFWQALSQCQLLAPRERLPKGGLDAAVSLRKGLHTRVWQSQSFAVISSLCWRFCCICPKIVIKAHSPWRRSCLEVNEVLVC